MTSTSTSTPALSESKPSANPAPHVAQRHEDDGYFFPWKVKSCVWLPVTALTVDVTVTAPPEAIDVSCAAVNVTMCTWLSTFDDVYVVSAGWS